MNPTIDFRGHDRAEQGKPNTGDALEFDLSGFHAATDYIREHLPRREAQQDAQEPTP